VLSSAVDDTRGVIRVREVDDVAADEVHRPVELGKDVREPRPQRVTPDACPPVVDVLDEQLAQRLEVARVDGQRISRRQLPNRQLGLHAVQPRLQVAHACLHSPASYSIEDTVRA
jgi:hypothetical protein